MARKADPRVTRLAVICLRKKAKLNQEEFARAARLTQGDVSDYELGNRVPEEPAFRRMARVAGVPWHVVVLLLRFFAAMLAAADRAGAPLVDRAVLDISLMAVTPYLLEEAEPDPPPIAELLQEAEQVWAVLEPLPPEERRRRIETAPLGACRSWAALTRRVCEASVCSAAGSAEEALDRARLALLIAERLSGEEGARAKAHGWGYAANARRVANDFDGADEAFARAWDVWPAGAASDSCLFPEWRLFDLEASLRRAQHQWPEALERLDKARACSGGDPLAAARILLKKEHVLQQMGDSAGALAVLEETAPLVEAVGDPHLLFTLSFNKADNLARLERFEAAEPLLPEVRRLAPGGLSGTRVLWLGAKVKAGLGHKEEAMAELAQVRDAFTAGQLPYDAALAALDLSRLWLEAGRTAEVRQESLAMAWIFDSKRIDREALAALALFCDAAKQDSATVELARQVIAEVERVRGSAIPAAG